VLVGDRDRLQRHDPLRDQELGAALAARLDGQ
jgi:hypothetical protein